ncbi:hypothetical protein ALC62_09417 [Cyphomyrmex costatus]|uniref:Gustatory receptor n=1 Tax=Cyphomyrmex costatus TaxID=456900 RepID=A0A195CGC7_9HYME|nr:hypothetical protein ALC62_09417 [Cyphomyrmex costatus]
MTSLQSALSPLLIFSSFWSLSMFEYPLGQTRPYLSYLYALAIWSLFTYFIFYPIIINKSLTIPGIYMNTIILISLITTTFINLFHFKELKMCLHELSIVDDTLEVLGARKEYQRLNNEIIRIIIAWTVHGFFHVFVYLSVEYYNFYDYINFIRICIAFVLNYPALVNVLNALIWEIVIGYMSSRFHQVNDCLNVLHSELFENIIDYRRRNKSILVCQQTTEVKDRKQYIWIIM